MTPDHWNKLFPVGTLVQYQIKSGHNTTPTVTQTTSEAYSIGSGIIVVEIEDPAGTHNIDFLKPIQLKEFT